MSDDERMTEEENAANLKEIHDQVKRDPWYPWIREMVKNKTLISLESPKWSKHVGQTILDRIKDTPPLTVSENTNFNKTIYIQLDRIFT